MKKTKKTSSLQELKIAYDQQNWNHYMEGENFDDEGLIEIWLKYEGKEYSTFLLNKDQYLQWREYLKNKNEKSSINIINQTEMEIKPSDIKYWTVTRGKTKGELNIIVPAHIVEKLNGFDITLK